MQQEVRRKVYFFRLAEHAEFQPKLEEAVAYIEDLPFNDQGRYLVTASDDVVLALFVTSATYPIKIQFGKIRRSALPMVEDGGDVSPLKIAQSAGILDWSHMVIFEDGTVAAEFNRDAPRIARLGEYLAFKSRGILPNAPRFHPLYQRDIIEELENFEAVTILEVEAPITEADLIAETDKNLGSALKACGRAGGMRRARIILKAEQRLDNKLKGLARKLVRHGNSREALTFLKATGKTVDGSRPLNLLEEYLISTEEFLRVDKRTRALASDHAFATLARAYENKRSRISSAATANAPW